MESLSRCPLAPEGQGVTFIELFFDLVFVFSVTQVVHLLHHGLDWGHAGQAVLVFWLVWWAWTQFTWALNPADTTHPWVEVLVLLATAVTFFMAVSLPTAFGEHAMLFGVAYVGVRAIGLGLYVWVTFHDVRYRKAVLRFTALSLLGLVAVLAGAWLGGVWQYVFWGAAIGLDLFAALLVGSDEGWNLDPEHFAERHGLFVIIALGEGIIVAAHGLEAGAWNGNRLATAVLAVVSTCGLWWTYFGRAKAHIEEGLTHLRTSSTTQVARDAYTVAHFPLLLGVIAFAVVFDRMLGEAVERVSPAVWVTTGLAMVLYHGAVALAMWRSQRRVAHYRGLVTLGSVGVCAWLARSETPLTPWVLLGGLALANWSIAIVEQRAACPNKTAASQIG